MLTDPNALQNHILHMQIEVFLAKINGDPDHKVRYWKHTYIPMLRVRLDRALQRERRAA